MVGSEQTNLQPNAREVVRGRFKVVEREGVFRGELLGVRGVVGSLFLLLLFF